MRTVEDWYKPNSSNKLIVRDTACLDYSNDNNASMALRMTFDGKAALWLGDLEKNDAELMGMYPTANLKSDILQLPHHLPDDHTTLVKTILPSISFANLSWQASQTRGKVFNYMIKIADYAGDIYYAGNETVGYCAEEGVFYRKDHVELDYGNWGNTTYDVRDVNPVTSVAVKANEQYYRYKRAKELSTGVNAYAIADHKTDWVLSYDAINCVTDKALPEYYIEDTLYFAASQHRFVNWNIQYSDYGTNDNSVIPNYGNYFGTVTIEKGTGDYWGATPTNRKLYMGNNVTFQSSGMYSSWSPLSNQVKTSSKGFWMDKMAAGIFLIYRYDNGTYYPLDLYDQAEVDANSSTSGGPTMRFCDMDEISSIRLGFYYLMVNDTSKNGSFLIDHIYIGPKDGVPVQEQSMFFDFGNTEADQLRYTRESYKGYNFDLAPKAPWVSRETSTTTSVMTNFTIDNSQGVVKIPVAENIAYEVTNVLYGPWFLTAAIHGTHPNNTMPSTMALSYDPAGAEYVQLRFKTEGCVNAPGRNPEVVTIYDRTVNGVSDRGDYDIMDYYKVENGKWITMTIPVSQEFKTAEYINSFGVRFRSIKAESKGSGRVVLDYLFAGPRSELPNQIAILRFTSEDGKVLQTLYHPIGTEAVFTGALPTKLADEGGQWIFAGWMDTNGNLVDLSQVTGDLELKPFFRREIMLNESIRISHSLNLASDISMNFAVEKSLLQEFDMDTVYLLTELDVYEDNVKVGTEVVKILPVEQEFYYYFTLNGLTAVRMNDRFRSVLYGIKNGLPYYSPTDDYSIADYAYSQLNKEGGAEKLKDLCAELLRYGSAAQSFKTYRTDALVDGTMTEEQLDRLTDLSTVTFGSNNVILNDLEMPSVTWTGKSLDLNSKVTLKYVFHIGSFQGSVNDLCLKVSYSDYRGQQRQAVVAGAEAYGSTEGYYAFTFDGLLAAELRTVVSARIYCGEEPVSYTLQYSADTYGNGKIGLLGTLCKALFAYSDRAKAFFA